MCCTPEKPYGAKHMGMHGFACCIPSGHMPFIMSKKKKIKMVEQYLDSLKEQVKDVEEYLAELEKEK